MIEFSTTLKLDDIILLPLSCLKKKNYVKQLLTTFCITKKTNFCITKFTICKKCKNVYTDQNDDLL